MSREILCTPERGSFILAAIFLKAKAPRVHTLSHARERNQNAQGTRGKGVLLLCFQSSCQISGYISNQSLAFYVTKSLKSLLACSRKKKKKKKVENE